MLRKLAIYTFTLALLGLVIAPPATAEPMSVFVPTESRNPLDQTRVLLMNTDSTAHEVKLRFIGHHADGTQGAEEGMKVTVPANHTTVVPNAAPPGLAGLIEVQSEGPVKVSAILTKEGALARDVPTGSVPVISSESSAAANGAIDLVGLQREISGGILSDVRIVNLGHEGTTCKAWVFRPDGAQLWGTFQFDDLPPLSNITFDDVLLALSELDGTNIRVRFSCDQPFYAYATLVDLDEQHLAFVTPAPSVQIAGFAGPSDGGGGGGGNASCTPGALCFTQSGVVHRAVKGDETFGKEYPVPAGIYSSLRLTFKVKNEKWSPRGSQHRYMLFWLTKNLKNRDMFGFSFVEGPNRNQATLRHGFNADHGNKKKISDGMFWPEGATYVVDYFFDTANDRIVHEIRHQDGTVLSRITSKPTIRKIHYDEAGRVSLGFGNEDKNLAGKEPFQYGWVWSDLKIELIPE